MFSPLRKKPLSASKAIVRIPKGILIRMEKIHILMEKSPENRFLQE